MNGVDYAVGGVHAMSLASPIFYVGLAAGDPVGLSRGVAGQSLAHQKRNQRPVSLGYTYRTTNRRDLCRFL